GWVKRWQIWQRPLVALTQAPSGTWKIMKPCAPRACCSVSAQTPKLCGLELRQRCTLTPALSLQGRGREPGQSVAHLRPVLPHCDQREPGPPPDDAVFLFAELEDLADV